MVVVIRANVSTACMGMSIVVMEGSPEEVLHRVALFFGNLLVQKHIYIRMQDIPSVVAPKSIGE